ncbi:MAG: hypothetical protein ACK4GJ_00205 [bacterium]
MVDKVRLAGTNYQGGSLDKYNKEVKVKEEGSYRPFLSISYIAADKVNKGSSLNSYEGDTPVTYIVDMLITKESMHKDPNRHQVVIVDFGKEEGAPFEGARIFYLKKDNNYGIDSPVIKNLGQVNMADPEFMKEILTEIIRKFPAAIVDVLVMDRGGVKGALDDEGGVLTKEQIEKVLEKVQEKTGVVINAKTFAI